MAATADYGVGPEKGIYGIYNDFFVRITSNTVGRFNFKYQIRVTAVNASPALSVTRLVEPIQSDLSIVINPVKVMQDAYFKEQTVSLAESALDNNEGVANFGYNQIQVEIGESWSTAADLDPVFQGYDTDNSFWFYNGYENVIPEPSLDSYENYRDTGWLFDTPIKLPLEIKNNRLCNGAFVRVSIPNIIEFDPNQLLIKNKVVTTYDLAGVAGTPVVTDISALFADDGYWVIETDPTINPATESKIEVYFQYEDQVTLGLKDTEIITYTPATGLQHTVYTLRWFNKYGGFEYFDFTGKTVFRQQVTKGKIINDGGINYEAGSFSAIKYIANPEKRAYGDTSTRFITLHSGWLTQEEVDALAGVQKTRNAFLIELETPTTYSVMPQSTSYEIINTQDKLAKVAVTFEVANFGKIQMQ